MAANKDKNAEFSATAGDSPRSFFFSGETAQQRKQVVFDIERKSGRVRPINAQLFAPVEERYLDSSTGEDENMTAVFVDGSWMPESELARREAVRKSNRDEIDIAIGDTLRSDLAEKVRHICSESESARLRMKAMRIMRGPAGRSWR